MTSPLLDRFLRYVAIDTTSDSSSPSIPSTPSQRILAELLAQELRELGVQDVVTTAESYTIARIPASPSAAPGSPAIALFSHLDTASDAPGADIRPQVHTNYDGGRIVLRQEPLVALDPAEDPELREFIGHTLVTTDGRTLLGADDKAGIAVIVTVVERLLRDPSLSHGPLVVVFNPDEEIARGIEALDVAALAATVGYTLDAGTVGTVSYETFSANKAEITITGRAEHPGTARGRMINAVMLGAKLLGLFPREQLAPESTDGRAGFLHPLAFTGTTESASITVLLRSFELEELDELGELLRTLCRAVEATAPGALVSCDITPQYRNMREGIEREFRAVELAREAVRAVGLTPLDCPMRGGTDGSVLTERGLPTPNLGRGGHHAHSVREWVSVQEMEKSVEIVLELLQRWAAVERR